MITAKVSDYRSKLASFHKKVIDDHNPLLISGKDGNVIVIPEDDYENLIETIYILQDKITMKALADAREQMNNNDITAREIKDVFSDVLDS